MGKAEKAIVQTMKVGTQDYPITGYVKSKRFGVVPVVDIPMMSDYTWQQLCLQSRLEHPERYAELEDVEATIAQLRKWLEEHSEKGAGVA